MFKFLSGSKISFNLLEEQLIPVFLNKKNQHFITFLSPLTAQTLFSKCAKMEKLEKTTNFEIAAVNSFHGQIASGLH